nr:hypothetical protein LKV13_04755 [Borrelia sp. BU AG58]
MNKVSICVLMLASTFIVSCEFWGAGSVLSQASGDADKKSNDLGAELAGNAIADNNAGEELTGGRNSDGIDDHIVVVNGNEGGIGNSKLKPSTQLTEEDMAKLKDFTEKTKTYSRDLDTVYNKNAGSFGKIMTYSTCSNYDVMCFSRGPSDDRKQGLDSLVNNKFAEEFDKLADILKKVEGYDPKSFSDAIAELKHVLKEAEDANSKIDVKDGNFNFRNASMSTVNENLAYLKKVNNVSTIAINTMKISSLAYADAFASLVSGISSSQFKEAVNEFIQAAKKYAAVSVGTRFTVITEVISPMIYGRNLDYEKSFASYGQGGKEFVAAIEKLEGVYKAVSTDLKANKKS